MIRISCRVFFLANIAVFSEILSVESLFLVGTSLKGERYFRFRNIKISC